MKIRIIVFFLLVLNCSYSQITTDTTQFRELKGKLLDKTGAIAGQNIYIKGTNFYSQTDFDGNFCLIVPKNFSIFIEIAISSKPELLEIHSDQKDLIINIENFNKSNNKAFKKWKRQKSILISKLNNFYNSNSYQDLISVYCR